MRMGGNGWVKHTGDMGIRNGCKDGGIQGGGRIRVQGMREEIYGAK